MERSSYSFLNLITTVLVSIITLPVSSETTQCTSITSGTAITINANNVTIDLNGWKLGGQAAGIGTAAIGIYAHERKNITIRKGIVRGFYWGIALDATNINLSQGHLIEDILADQNTQVGLIAVGMGIIVRRNQVVDTGGSTVTSPILNGACGIYMMGAGGRVLNNDIIGVEPVSGFSYSSCGVLLSSSDGTVAESNRIDGISGDGPTAGIFIASFMDVLAARNRITYADNGIV